MAVAVAVTSIVNADPGAGIDSTRTREIVYGTLTLSGTYGTSSSHGDTVNFASAFIQSDYPPTWVEIHENVAAGSAPLGYTYIYNNGTTIANGVLTILGTQASGAATTGSVEFTEAAAYSGGTPSLAGAVLRFRAEFAKSV